MPNPALTIDIGASTKAYDKAMKSIGDKADDTVSKIESKFESFDPQLNTDAYIKSLTSMAEVAGQLAAKLGLAGGAVIALGTATAVFGAVTALVVKLNAALSETADTAERVGITLQEYQEKKFGANSIGIGDDQFNGSLDNFATNLQNAKFSVNDLTRAFQANGVAINDINGKQKDTNKLLDAAVDIVQRQKTVQDAIQVGGFFGFSKSFSQSIKDAGSDFQDLASKAKSVGAVIDDATVEKAKEFTKQWDAATTVWAVGLKAAVVDILPALTDAVETAISFLKTISSIYSTIKSIKDAASSPEAQLAATGEVGVFGFQPGQGSQPSNGRRQVVITGGTSSVPVPKPRPDSAPQPPPDAINPGPARTAEADAVERAINSLNKHNEAVKADANAMGQGAAAQARFRAEALETAAVQANGGKETAAQIARFKELQDAAAAAAETLARAQVTNAISRGQQTSLLSPEDVQIANQLKDVYPQVADALKSTEAAALRTNQAFSGLSSQISGDLTSGLTDIASGTKSVKQGFSDMASSIIRDIQQMIIRLSIVQPLMRGLQGAFGGGIGSLFGGGGGAAAASSAVGNPTVLSGLYASGTDYAAGGLSLVGEKGPELLNIPRGSQVIPNDVLKRGGMGGGVNSSVNISIDARGADSAGLARLQTQVAKLQADLPMRVVAAVTDAKKKRLLA